MPSYLTHYVCGRCDRHHAIDEATTVSSCCKLPLLARYDLAAAQATVTRAALDAAPAGLWRYRDVLPVRDAACATTLGEGGTPLLAAPRLAARLGLTQLHVKDESANPTSSFKARGLAVAVSLARERGVTAFAAPSAGNAAVALSAFAARAGAEAHVFMPRDVPPAIERACRRFGAHVTLVDGLITDAGKAAQTFVAEHPGVLDVSTLKEPGRVEGKKTMAYEVVQQLGWRVPDVVVYPTGGGTGIVGMWKAFEEMEGLGLIGPERPRFVSVQSAGCAPIVRALDAGTDTAEAWQDAATRAHGLRVPRAIGDFLILRALRASKGTAVAVPDDAIAAAEATLARDEGLDAGPETAAAYAGLAALVAQGEVRANDEVVLFHTGSSLPYGG